MRIDSMRLKIELARHSMNISELSEKSGISSNTINSWLKNKGKRNPTTKSIGIIANTLGIDVTDIIED